MVSQNVISATKPIPNKRAKINSAENLEFGVSHHRRTGYSMLQEVSVMAGEIFNIC